MPHAFLGPDAANAAHPERSAAKRLVGSVHLANPPQLALLDGIAGQYQLFQRIHVLGLVWATVVLIVWFVS